MGCCWLVIVQILWAVGASQLAIGIDKADFLQELQGSSAITIQGTLQQCWSGEFSGQLKKSGHWNADHAFTFAFAIHTKVTAQMPEHIGNAVSDTFAVVKLINQALGGGC